MKSPLKVWPPPVGAHWVWEGGKTSPTHQPFWLDLTNSRTHTRGRNRDRGRKQRDASATCKHACITTVPSPLQAIAVVVKQQSPSYTKGH